MPYLEIRDWGGRIYYSVLLEEKSRSDVYKAGDIIYIEITPALAALSLEDLKLWHEGRRHDEDAKTAAAKEARKSELLTSIVRIIKESVHEGERENAKAFYAKYTGRPFVE